MVKTFIQTIDWHHALRLLRKSLASLLIFSLLASDIVKAMEDEGLIARVSTYGKARWCRKKISLGNGPWVKHDNGIRLGMYYPPRPVTEFAELVKRHAIT